MSKAGFYQSWLQFITTSTEIIFVVKIDHKYFKTLTTNIFTNTKSWHKEYMPLTKKNADSQIDF